MNYRELLVGSLSATAVCVFSLLVSESSFASSANHDSTSDASGVMSGSFYVSGSYSPTFPSVTSFDIKEAGRDSSSIRSYSKASPTLNISIPANFDQEGHSFKFAKNLLTSFEGAAGYSMGGARVEVEAGYKKFAAVADGDYRHADASSFVGIGRERVFTDDNYFVMKIDGITDISVMLNACYDVMHTELPVSPYVCAGLGASFLDLANHTTSKLAYRGKVGISYQLTPEISLLAGGFYHGLFDEKFENIPATNRVNFPGEALAAVKSNIASYGFNLGARFAFN